jgi:hypothetical protein
MNSQINRLVQQLQKIDRQLECLEKVLDSYQPIICIFPNDEPNKIDTDKQ